MNSEITPEKNFTIDLVQTDGDLEQILALQQHNLAFTQDGFVTVVHTLDILREFHRLMPSVVARHQGEVIAYALSMPRETAALIPVLTSMFERINDLPVLANKRWYVMGQVCVDQAWRGRGLFDGLYAGHRQHFAADFDWLVTEIAMRNPRSLAAHARAGFVEIDHFGDDVDEWSVVGLQFK
jgi:predicted GNAT superfamily acetyltransferase